MVPVKVRKDDDELVLLMANRAKVSAQISNSRARVHNSYPVRIGERDLKTGSVAAELLETGIADRNGSASTVKLQFHWGFLLSQWLVHIDPHRERYHTGTGFG